MLYVFHVDSGSMMTLEMKLTLEKVKALKESIYRETKIPLEKQVLLISGGEALDDEQNVSSYHAGTDTNPIFLFSIAIIQSETPKLELDITADPELQNIFVILREIEASKNLPASYSTVQSRADLSQRIHAAAKDLLNACKKIIMHQHLQQQGWAAVLANLEDIVLAVQKLYENCVKHFTEYLQLRENSINILDKLPEDLALISKIPLLQVLLRKNRHSLDGASIYAQDSNLDFESNELDDQCKLIDLIIPKGQNIEVMGNTALDFREKLVELDDETLNNIHFDYKKVMDFSERNNLKVIEGLEERFSTLENKMREGDRCVEDLNNYAKSFETNFISSKTLNDRSVYPDLCASQVHQLNVMSSLLGKIKESRINCLRSKHELSGIIIVRLKWILYVEKQADSLKSTLLMHTGHLKRLKNDLSKYEQIHTCPKLYFLAITEVIRRRLFHKNFSQWTLRLSEENKSIWEEEVNIREKFLDQFSSHFLNEYFPGLKDLPPAFATEPPETFDDQLPNINVECLDLLRESIPELSALLELQEPGGIPRVIQEGLTPKIEIPFRSLDKEPTTGDVFASAVTTAGDRIESQSPIPTRDGATGGSPVLISRPTSLIKDHPESETDTEEFEKVCGSEGTYSPMETMASKVPHSKVKLKGSHYSSEELCPLPTSEQLSSSTKEQLENPDLCLEDLMRSSQSSEGSNRPVNAQNLNVLPVAQPCSITMSQENLPSSKSASNIEISINNCNEMLTNLENHLSNSKEKMSVSNPDSLQGLSDKLKNCLTLMEECHPFSEVSLQENLENERLNHQLSDAHKEIDVYQEEIYKQKSNIEQLESDNAESMRQLTDEKNYCITKLTLEHEVEMENLKQQLQEEGNKKDEEVETLQQKLVSVDAKLKKCEEELQNCNKDIDAKFQVRLDNEKDRIVDILETNFCEREKKALENLKIELEKERSESLKKLEEEHRQAMDGLQHKCDLLTRENANLSATIDEAEDKLSEEIMKCRNLWEAQKDDEIEEKILKKTSRIQADHEAELEKAKHSHRMEMENLRSRFKLVTMDRSPSETSLEKCEKGDFIDMSRHESTLAKLKDEYCKEKQGALEELKKSLEASHQTRLEEFKRNQITKWKYEEKKLTYDQHELFNAALKEVTLEKEKVIQSLKLKVELLADENEKLIEVAKSSAAEEACAISPSKSRGTFFVQGPAECDVEEYKNRIESLQTELTRLKLLSGAYDKEHSDIMNSTVSETLPLSQLDTSPSNVKRLILENVDLKNALVRYTTGSVKISILNCYPYDFILVVYDETYNHYRVFLDSHNKPNLHFLHTDSYEGLGLSKISTNKKPEKQFCLAEVIKKEFCQAKKAENRFRVPKGTKFYRVTAKSVELPPEESKPKEPTVRYSPPPMTNLTTQAATCKSTLSGVSEENDNSLTESASAPGALLQLTEASTTTPVDASGSIPQDVTVDISTSKQ